MVLGLTLTQIVFAATVPDVSAYLEACEASYDPAERMLQQVWKSPGYHSPMPSGETVHATRDSLAYALALLIRGGEADKVRAAEIIPKVLSLQDTDPASKTYGIWPWLLEEPLDKMAPPDWNWADFLGILLAQALVDHGDQLSPKLAAAMRESLNHAAQAIVQRDVDPSYTNIAILGAGVTVVAGEVLGDAALLAYGANRLRRVVEHHDYHGGFREYNSPTYTMVSLYECERILQLARHEAARGHAETLRRHCWQVVAEHYHPGTGQWAGPNSRTKDRWIKLATVRYLRAQTGADIPLHPDARKPRLSWPHLVRGLPVPSEFANGFERLPDKRVTIAQRAFRREPESDSTLLTTFLTPEYCVGSVNHDTFWDQRHVLKAYWMGPDDLPAMLRVRFLHDGQDFATGIIRSAQRENRVLAAINWATDRGDFHPTLDRPEGGVFTAKDFRVRFELIHDAAKSEQHADNLFLLQAGKTRAIVHTLGGTFGEHPVAWKTGTIEDGAVVEAVCYQGEARAFRPAEIGAIALGVGLEIVSEGELPVTVGPKLQANSSDQIRLEWEGLTLGAPVVPQPSPY
jgi:hypothetical protein